MVWRRAAGALHLRRQLVEAKRLQHAPDDRPEQVLHQPPQHAGRRRACRRRTRRPGQPSAARPRPAFSRQEHTQG